MFGGVRGSVRGVVGVMDWERRKGGGDQNVCLDKLGLMGVTRRPTGPYDVVAILDHTIKRGQWVPVGKVVVLGNWARARRVFGS